MGPHGFLMTLWGAPPNQSGCGQKVKATDRLSAASSPRVALCPPSPLLPTCGPTSSLCPFPPVDPRPPSPPPGSSSSHCSVFFPALLGPDIFHLPHVRGPLAVNLVFYKGFMRFHSTGVNTRVTQLLKWDYVLWSSHCPRPFPGFAKLSDFLFCPGRYYGMVTF